MSASVTISVLRTAGLMVLLGACGDDIVEHTIDDGDRTIRFVVIGDSGTGDDLQRRVAGAIAERCVRDGCDFVVMTGDNIYDAGVNGVDDPAWGLRFEEPYGAIELPFHPVMGNHDCGGEILGVDIPGLGNDSYKGPINVEYSHVSPRWRMPATHYTLVRDHVGLVFLDTTSLMFGDTENGDQVEWYDEDGELLFERSVRRGAAPVG